jgi:hypothetical protein
MKLFFNSWIHNPKRLPARRIKLNLSGERPGYKEARIATCKYFMFCSRIFNLQSLPFYRFRWRLHTIVQINASVLSFRSMPVTAFLIRLESPSKESVLNFKSPGMVQEIRPPYCEVVRLLVNIPVINSVCVWFIRSHKRYLNFSFSLTLCWLYV